MLVYLYKYIFVLYLHVISLFTNDIPKEDSADTVDTIKQSERRPLVWNNINFLHTTDTHSWYGGHYHQSLYSGNWGHFVSFVERMKEIAHSNHQDLLVVDSGDKHDGNGLSDLTSPNGVLLLPIFMKQTYDVLSIGNHEMYLWENFAQERNLVVKHFTDNYISTNVEFEVDGEFQPLSQKYKYFETEINKYRVLAFGFLFDFTRNCNGSRIIPMREVAELKWFLDVLEKYSDKVDLIVINGHTPITPTWDEFYFVHDVIRSHFPDIKIQYFGGHSHIRDFRVFDNLLTGIQSGRFCETVGWMSIDMENGPNQQITDIFHRSYIDFNPASFMAHSNFTELDKFMTPKGEEVSDKIVEAKKKLDLDMLIGYVPNNYFMDRVPQTHPKNLYKLLTQKILPLLENNSTLLERIIIINSGSVRYDLYKGDYTVDTHFIISPFQNKWVKLTLPKHVAIKISHFLNSGRYINFKLLPLHHQFETFRQMRLETLHKITKQFHGDISEDFDSREEKTKLPTGYVTHDDFGNTGDDTPHKPIRFHYVPNVVESRQFSKDFKGNDLCDVVFYDFITPNIMWALSTMGYSVKEEDVEFYSADYLGLLIDEFARNELAKVK